MFQSFSSLTHCHYFYRDWHIFFGFPSVDYIIYIESLICWTPPSGCHLASFKATQQFCKSMRRPPSAPLNFDKVLKYVFFFFFNQRFCNQDAALPAVCNHQNANKNGANQCLGKWQEGEHEQKENRQVQRCQPRSQKVPRSHPSLHRPATSVRALCQTFCQLQYLIYVKFCASLSGSYLEEHSHHAKMARLLRISRNCGIQRHHNQHTLLDNMTTKCWKEQEPLGLNFVKTFFGLMFLLLRIPLSVKLLLD